MADILPTVAASFAMLLTLTARPSARQALEDIESSYAEALRAAQVRRHPPIRQSGDGHWHVQRRPSRARSATRSLARFCKSRVPSASFRSRAHPSARTRGQAMTGRGRMCPCY
jgi:hypothetical protein